MKLVDPIRYVQLKSTGRLPSPKGLALAIVRLLQQDDYKIDELVRLVQSDPAIAGELLKFSNAASFGHSRPIVSLSEAVTTLGTLRVRLIVLALSVLHGHRSGQCPQFNYEQYWARALAGAISAQALASYVKISGEENFSAGLLCSLGELALASIFPERYGEIIATSGDDLHKRLALEREAFGNDHRELTATLLLEWGLPEALVTAIYHCEAPDDASFQDGSRIHGLTLSLHVALAMAKICVADEGARWSMLPNLYTKAARLGISTEDMNSMADSITASWQEWGDLLKIQTREITSFAELLASYQPRELESTSPVCEWPNNKSVLLISTVSPEFSEIIGQLEANGYAVKFASNSTDGQVMAIEEKPDLILVEMSSPGIDGSAFCKALRGHSLGQATYIILLVNHEDEGLLSQALDMGADDILPQPITALAVHAKLRSAFKILQLQKELVKERNGLVNSAGEWAGTNRRLTQVAMTDPLTQLANRRHGQDFLSSEWAFAKANNLPLACLMIDIDHFKNVNDQNGHKAGDAILVKLANLLQASSRSGDLVFRFGGEEFCIICSGATLEMACAVAERVRRNVAGQAFQFGDIKISVTVSIGVATMTPVHVDEDALIHDADAAMYCAKKAGRNRVMSSVLTHTVMKRQIDWPLIHTQHELAEIAKLQHKRQNIYPLQGKTVGQILMHHGIISDETISVVRAIQKREAYKNKPIGETLVEIGIVNQDMLTRSLLIQAGIPMADVLSIDIPPEIIKIILIAKTHDKLAVPIGNYHNTLYLAVPDPFTFTDQPFFTVMTGMKVSLVFAPMHDIVNRLNIHGFSRKHGGMAKEEFSIPAKTV